MGKAPFAIAIFAAFDLEELIIVNRERGAIFLLYICILGAKFNSEGMRLAIISTFFYYL